MWTKKKRHDASTAHVSFPIFPSLACFSTFIANKQTKKKITLSENAKSSKFCQLGQHVKTAAKIKKKMSLAKQTSIQAGCRCECSVSIWKYKSDCIFYVALWTWSHIKATYGTFSNVFITLDQPHYCTFLHPALCDRPALWPCAAYGC